MATQRLDVPVNGTLFVAPMKDGSYSATLDGESLGTSKHPDYWAYHLKLGDVKRIKEAKFARIAYTTARNRVESVVEVAELLAAKRTRQAAAKSFTFTSAMDSAATKEAGKTLLKRIIIDVKV